MSYIQLHNIRKQTVIRLFSRKYHRSPQSRQTEVVFLFYECLSIDIRRHCYAFQKHNRDQLVPMELQTTTIACRKQRPPGERDLCSRWKVDANFLHREPVSLVALTDQH